MLSTCATSWARATTIGAGATQGPLILLAGLPGEHHEIGLLLFALAAHESGYRVLPLGANMPLDELAAVAGPERL